MLAALETGVKGNKWFSLNDKVSREETLRLAWEQVRRNGGSAGIDAISVKRFKDRGKGADPVEKTIAKRRVQTESGQAGMDQ